jgi:hypothetical protein
VLAIFLDEFLNELLTESESGILPASFIVAMDDILKDVLTAAEELKLGITHLFKALQLQLLQTGYFHILEAHISGPFQNWKQLIFIKIVEDIILKQPFKS